MGQAPDLRDSRISQISINVHDIDRAVGFYRDTLGLRLGVHVPGKWASLNAPDGTSIGLHPAGPRSPAPGGRGGVTIGLGVDQALETVVAELTRRGVRFFGPIGCLEI